MRDYPTMAREKTVQESIIRLLTKRGAWYHKVHQAGRGRAGVPDILACYRGVFVAIEVKGDSGHETSVHQIKELRAIRMSGGYSMVAHNVEQVERLLDYFDQFPPVAMVRGNPLPDLPTLRVVSL